ncbi:MAG: rpsI [Solirubrobacterales bacterium]|jgi:small subunit ribosomal protein S9|nr:rpsI [Solirubrobacterales bacterium]
MTDEPNETNEQPEATEPEAQPEGDVPAAEQPEPEQPAAEQHEPPPEGDPEPEAEQAEPEQAEPEQAEQPAADQPPAATPSGEKPKAKDQPPGAELEPIAIEPERELSAEERARLEAEEEERARLEAEEDAGDEPVARSGPQVEIPAGQQIQATGKRKSSIARVILRPGDGGFEVNSRSLDEYFPRQYLRAVARQPLLTAGYESSVNVQVRVHGGGITGQAGAVRHGVARALCEVDPELRPELKRRGLLTRDARKKERRKAGLKKARKRPQFSKR